MLKHGLPVVCNVYSLVPLVCKITMLKIHVLHYFQGANDFNNLESMNLFLFAFKKVPSHVNCRVKLLAEEFLHFSFR